VIFLTSGDKADHENPASQTASEKKHITDYSLMREKEAEKALSILGVADYEFLRFPDRELAENYGEVLKRLLQITGDYLPDAIYSPSMAELNPDHRTAATISIDIRKAYPNISERAPFKDYILRDNHASEA
jgi:LmbE family N-acetylglucosaminyl deacetylase